MFDFAEFQRPRRVKGKQRLNGFESGHLLTETRVSVVSSDIPVKDSVSITRKIRTIVKDEAAALGVEGFGSPYHFCPQAVPLSPPEHAFPAATADARSNSWTSTRVEGINWAVAAMKRDT
ncbi:hypothetical protein RRF57_000046 [Xylaria bambusicola]|uniref:Uncharacterized protein n=1 Tax=Xylaria bambusicola TaxID=326684 RepID=A0AAN7UEW4_9PEZI